MSGDYRYQITEHQGIPCLHVITEIEESTDEPQNAFAHTYIPIDDIEASIAKWHKGTYGQEEEEEQPASTEPPLALKIISMILKTDHDTQALNAGATALRFEQLLVGILQLCQQELAKQNEEFVSNSILSALQARFPDYRFVHANGEYIAIFPGDYTVEQAKQSIQEVDGFVASLQGRDRTNNAEQH